LIFWLLLDQAKSRGLVLFKRTFLVKTKEGVGSWVQEHSFWYQANNI
jgi:hypothetical protein